MVVETLVYQNQGNGRNGGWYRPKECEAETIASKTGLRETLCLCASWAEMYRRHPLDPNRRTELRRGRRIGERSSLVALCTRDGGGWSSSRADRGRGQGRVSAQGVVAAAQARASAGGLRVDLGRSGPEQRVTGVGGGRETAAQRRTASSTWDGRAKVS
ncbi:hypothetical protein K491DRAFT_524346 [Lophiostoma macrostomum CBS 122681]|uniref:Uncharacterized protein n=1 Tax=Lophiostoma macrostomum CBS 122681 TaxID=1314788 RepID=A0A6A6T1N2_9PLEO|nr:hypothetical protein K491DRAFT_524346 [Lophiostoma macrostomum CBS 122681]